MITTHERNDPVRLMWRRALLLGLLLLVIFALSGVWDIYRKERESADLRAQAEAQLADLKTRQAQLSAQIGTLQTQRGMEEAVRRQYAVGKSGEGMIVIVEPDTPPPAPEQTSVMQWLKGVLSRF